MLTPFPEPLAERLCAPHPGVSIYWLGQAGFVIAADRWRIVIDPYLSDSLGKKYRGKRFEHERLMPAPVTPADIGPVDLVLISHHHTDHMDAETLAPLARAQPACRFVVPRASMAAARERIGVGDDRLIDLDAGEKFSPFQGLSITAVRAAHEALELSPEGWHRYLGYVVRAGSSTIFHSGDSVPFDGQADELSPFGIDLALLPVNGRKAELTAAGIAGNYTIDEACKLADQVQAEDVICHHYGMFAFNTVPAEAVDAKSRAGDCGPRVHRAKLSVEYRLVN